MPVNSPSWLARLAVVTAGLLASIAAIVAILTYFGIVPNPFKLRSEVTTDKEIVCQLAGEWVSAVKQGGEEGLDVLVGQASFPFDSGKENGYIFNPQELRKFYRSMLDDCGTSDIIIEDLALKTPEELKLQGYDVKKLNIVPDDKSFGDAYAATLDLSRDGGKRRLILVYQKIDGEFKMRGFFSTGTSTSDSHMLP